MGLIEAERDDDALLQAEDEAIRAANTEQPEKAVPLGGELAQLIESLSNGDTDPQAV